MNVTTLFGTWALSSREPAKYPTLIPQMKLRIEQRWVDLADSRLALLQLGTTLDPRVMVVWALLN